MATRILPTNPGANCQAHRPAIDAAIKRVLDGGWYILGREVEAFEQEFAAFVGTAAAVGVGNGTDAITLALRSLGIGAGDAVLTVSHTAVATVAAIELAGATPVLLDVEPATYTLAPEAVAAALANWQANPACFGGARPAAILAVHLYGQPADLPRLLELARRHQLRLVEDCAQAHGASLDGKPVGTWGAAATFSFYPTKNLGAIGDGGAVILADRELDRQARRIREYGWEQRSSVVPGMNSRLDELQAAILRAKLPALAVENARRRQIAARYAEQLAGCVELPANRSGQQIGHVYHQFVVQHDRRDQLRAFLAERQIATLIHYPQAVHQQPAYANRPAFASQPLPVTNRLCQRILSLPIYPELTDQEVDRVSAAIRDFACR